MLPFVALLLILTKVQCFDFSRIVLPKDTEFFNTTYDTNNKESFFTDYRRVLNEDILLPSATVVRYQYNDTDTLADIMFYAKLTKTSNCRASYDKLDCPFCKEILPDAHVVVTYGKNPLGVSGHISVSEDNKTIYVVVRGAASMRNKITYGVNEMIQHPFIPNAQVHKGMLLALLSIRDTIAQTLDDQLKLHPEYKVVVAGHSFGAGVASLVAVDIQQQFPQLDSTRLKARLLGKPRVGNEGYVAYIGDNNIDLIRYVQYDDGTAHEPSLLKGYLVG
ncbi:Lipase [Choanephora cucurbitarum]|uniref:Lipase n=1 Tax=Choanephora cucurbitarum TaxID=101091 RepID=A0A1C7NGJ6_9FUNG|nr:Lipase [Choanephora cucurbitarum]